ncbi:MAG: class I SAM-dependent methyltransferase [Proteobacteria bacterium]|nr:class I SAM-dependent methyltransferase [Pseudomonadota bacterium]
MSRQSLQLDDQVYDYLLSISLRESDLLKKLREETAELPLARMQIAPEQGQFFSFLIKVLNVKNAIEIGVFTGYSSLCIAMAMADDGKLIACDIDEEYTNLAQSYWSKAGVEKKIDLRLAPAIETLDKLIEENKTGFYDFIFIDAHKPEYIDYYERSLKLLKTGGVIAVDNVLWDGNPVDPEKQDEDTNAIRAFNEHVFQDKRVFISTIPVGDGVTLVTKN